MSQYMKPNPEGLKKINHIIVLMLENRSFDNLLGWLYDDERPPRGQEFEGLRKELWNPLNSVDANGIPIVEKVFVKKNGAPIKGTKFIKANPNPDPDFTLPHPDPGEGYRDTNHQLFENYIVPDDYPPEPTNMGFVNNYVNTIVNGAYRIFGGKINDPRDIMTCYTPEQVPVLSKLAKEFAVCDHWYGSIPSQTLPNRDFFHAATSCGRVNNKPVSTCDAKTIYNQMEDAIKKGADLSWRVYASTPKKFSHDAKVDSLTAGGRDFSLTRLIMTQLHDASLTPNFQPIDEFFEDAGNGKLPNYAFLEPHFSGPGQNDQHPPSDIRPGEQLIAEVYEAIRDSPQWEETLLVITYDEHGGCYDHVPPPAHAKPPDGIGAPGQNGFTFRRFGVRVPAVLISPYIEPGTICRPAGWTPFDHTSVIATVQKRFDLDGHLTERDKAAPDLSCVLTLDTARTDKPEVNPLPFDGDMDLLHINDLHKLCEEVLTELTGNERPDEQHIHDFIVETFAKFSDNL
jgi:phospholipase C